MILKFHLKVKVNSGLVNGVIPNLREIPKHLNHHSYTSVHFKFPPLRYDFELVFFGVF